MKSLLSVLFLGGLLLSGCQKESVEPQSVAASAQAADAKSGDRSFSAHLSGDQEVPAVPTNATGQANFKLSKDGNSLSYKLIVANIRTTVIFGHLHLGNAGTNGPVVVDLVGRTGPSPQGVIAEGIITSASLKGRLAGQPLSALIAAMEAGSIYTNVHSTAYPGGEVRGQVR
ncbi:CHRD domain-containing protein [Hymenobacter arizonensis]|uniref:CHRD domain-containing protein n=1 Tax=Hymenobacter arizonensis TaxID=1227077 RepID=A0A1I6B6G5_HYMAR|nr:CHRD domain-containing protein [Hymenobacter arizonensis]SFQ76530.1 CHRD domain-containing protein [Hymenobacter arizonensis]